MKENPRFSIHERKAMLEVTALGLGGVGTMLIMYGMLDYRHGQELLRNSEAIREPLAVEFAKEIIGRGVREALLGVAALSGFTGAIVKRIRS